MTAAILLPGAQTDAGAPSPANALPALSLRRIEEIAGWLPPAPGDAIPTFDDRAFWSAAASLDSARETLRAASARASEPPPALTEALFDNYRRLGERRSFDRPFAVRLHQLRERVLAEGVEGRGRFLPGIEESLIAILDEPSWIISAHAGGRETWVSTRDLVDLGAAARVWTLAMSDWLLGDRLRADTRRRLREEARDRVFRPYLERVRARDRRDFHWMASAENWNAVCNAGVLGAALLLVESPRERAEFVAAFEAYAPFFIGGFGDDGLCDEGPGYWEFGFGHFLVAAETIREATGGRLDLLREPKVARIAQSGSRMEIAGGVYPAFGDAAVDFSPAAWLLDFSALRYGVGSVRSEPSFNLQRLYHTTFDLKQPRPPAPVAGGGGGIVGIGSKNPPAPRDWFPDGGLLIARGPDPRAGLAVALKGGNNGVPHNHNDLGTFVVVADGRLALADVGADLPYTRDSFGPRRYESEVMSSLGHPVPLVAGKPQRTGAAARALTTRLELEGGRDVWELDLTSAYDEPALERLTRTFVYDRAGGGALEITDRVRFSAPRTFGGALILLPGQTWERIAGDRLRIRGEGVSVDVAFTAEGGGLVFAERPVRGISPGRPPKALRLGIDFEEPVLEAVLRLDIRPGPASAPCPQSHGTTP